MTPPIVGALVSGLLGAAGWLATSSLRRAPVSLEVARRQMFGADASISAPRSTALTRWIEQRHGAGLVVIDMTPSDVVTRILVATSVVGFAAVGGVVTLLSAGLLPASPIWVGVPVVVAPAAGWVMLADVGSRIERRRRELRQAANDFVQLVAVGLTTDQSVEEAIAFALEVGAGPAADLLHRGVSTAPQRGVAVWDALDEAGRVYGIRELCEFSSSVERQGLQGVSIGTTVATLAAAMRAKALDQLERDADRANANLVGPTIGFVVATIVFLAYPLAVRISEAFGG